MGKYINYLNNIYKYEHTSYYSFKSRMHFYSTGEKVSVYFEEARKNTIHGIQDIFSFGFLTEEKESILTIKPETFCELGKAKIHTITQILSSSDITVDTYNIEFFKSYCHSLINGLRELGYGFKSSKEFDTEQVFTCESNVIKMVYSTALRIYLNSGTVLELEPINPEIISKLTPSIINILAVEIRRADTDWLELYLNA